MMQCTATRLGSALTLVCFVTISCTSNDGADAHPGTAAPDPIALSTLPIKHLVFDSAKYSAEVRNDLPESLSLTLNSLPGKMGGSPQTAHEWVRGWSTADALRIPWDSLLAGGHLGAPASYADSLPFRSLAPAATRMMRIGTFAETLDGESVFADKDDSFESYGFYSIKYQAPVMAVYFDGRAELKGPQAQCDGLDLTAELSVPKAGLYFVMSQYDGLRFKVSALPDTSGLVFSVSTTSAAFNAFVGQLAARLNCKDA